MRTKLVVPTIQYMCSTKPTPTFPVPYISMNATTTHKPYPLHPHTVYGPLHPPTLDGVLARDFAWSQSYSLGFTFLHGGGSHPSVFSSLSPFTPLTPPRIFSPPPHLTDFYTSPPPHLQCRPASSLADPRRPSSTLVDPRRPSSTLIDPHRPFMRPGLAPLQTPHPPSSPARNTGSRLSGRRSGRRSRTRWRRSASGPSRTRS